MWGKRKGDLWLAACGLLLLSFYSHGQNVSDSNNQQALALLERIDNLYRLDSSEATITMEVKTENWQRSMTMMAWSKDMDYTLVRITSPKKEKGISTLKRDNQMWNYFPKIRKVIKVPPSMMMGSWMGSDFTNDDLVREVSLAKEYSVSLSSTHNVHTLTLIPKPNTVTVWGKIIAQVDTKTLLPIKQTYFDEDGTAMREMAFSENKKFDGKLLPSVMTLTPLNKNNQFTKMTYEQLTFNTDIKADVFTLRNLKRR